MTDNNVIFPQQYLPFRAREGEIWDVLRTTLVCWGSNGSRMRIEVVYILVSMHPTDCVSKCRKPAADFKKQVACIYSIDM